MSAYNCWPIIQSLESVNTLCNIIQLCLLLIGHKIQIYFGSKVAKKHGCSTYLFVKQYTIYTLTWRIFTEICCHNIYIAIAGFLQVVSYYIASYLMLLDKSLVSSLDWSLLCSNICSYAFWHFQSLPIYYAHFYAF